ncbi:Ig-like domain-containing protein [Catenovulum adriaticum]|uniref:Cadherin-like domain-containing protein n=1 Tax=Catenovulum adriaticum TaxID=2984846 RepID=A0ABY7ANZ1_9ALTE|nr:Ig-like domain-containing protein [Catenovulum sp. TS8]WAJ70437.1 cadherin-like domain-containing protein [Catenovulum sp. TS8]
MNSQLSKIPLACAFALALGGCDLLDDDDNDNDKPEENMAPVVETLSVMTQTDTQVMEQITATDADGDTLTYTVTTDPMKGMLELNDDGSFTYTPNSEFTGSDSFEFEVSDGVNAAVNGMVNIDIEALEVTFSSYSRSAFNQMETDEPLSTNGRNFIQDVTTQTAYDDLLIDQ